MSWLRKKTPWKLAQGKKLKLCFRAPSSNRAPIPASLLLPRSRPTKHYIWDAKRCRTGTYLEHSLFQLVLQLLGSSLLGPDQVLQLGTPLLEGGIHRLQLSYSLCQVRLSLQMEFLIRHLPD